MSEFKFKGCVKTAFSDETGDYYSIKFYDDLNLGILLDYETKLLYLEINKALTLNDNDLEEKKLVTVLNIGYIDLFSKSFIKAMKNDSFISISIKQNGDGFELKDIIFEGGEIND